MSYTEKFLPVYITGKRTMSTDILSRKINIKHFAIKFAERRERLEGDTTRRHDVVIVSVRSCFSANEYLVFQNFHVSRCKRTDGLHKYCYSCKNR